jgi:hypothetical protein
MYVPPIRDNKVLRLNIPMKNTNSMTGGDGIAHLTEHGRNETQP